MDYITAVLIGIGLSMDAFAVSISTGINFKYLKMRHALRIASYFGLFQAIMPIIGWFLGFSLQKYVSEFDHWIAFILLSFVGGKMIYESYKNDQEDKVIYNLSKKLLFTLAIATSIDALAVGISLSFLKTIVTPAIIIGIITFSLSFTGVQIGNRFGHFSEKRLEVYGGVILIGMGIKILLEHLINHL
jgi:manganese efflux pump family protein